MAPAEDTTGHYWDQYIPTSLDDLHSASSHFFGAHHQPTHSLFSRDQLSEYSAEMSSIKASNDFFRSGTMDQDISDKPESSTASKNGAPQFARHGKRQRRLKRSTSPLTPSINASSSSKISSNFDSLLDSPEVASHVEIKSQTPPHSPTLPSMFPGDLPLAYSQHFLDDQPALSHSMLSHISNKGSLSPLSLFKPWKGDFSSLPCDVYDSTTDPEALGPLHELGDISSVADHNDAYPSINPLFGSFTWTSPGSSDTDLDDESISSSTSSLSPEYSDSELRHSSTESEEDEEEGHYSPPCSSPPLYRHANDELYHHIEQYPEPFDMYHHRPADDDVYADLPALSPPSPAHERPSKPSLNAPSHQPPTPPGQHEPFGLGLSDYPDASRFYTPFYRTFDDESITVPCSPSRRRSTDLPTFDDDSFGLQTPLDPELFKSPQRAAWLSLPGAETDDDLIPSDLASKNYVPDPTITVPTTPPSSSSGGLLIWDPDSNDTMLRPPRPPSPEDFHIDPSVVAELAGDEGEKIYKLRERTARKESWERERYGELSALLRLKLKLDERHGAAGGTSAGDAGAKIDVRTDSVHQSSQLLAQASNTAYSAASHPPTEANAADSVLEQPSSSEMETRMHAREEESSSSQSSSESPPQHPQDPASEITGKSRPNILGSSSALSPSSSILDVGLPLERPPPESSASSGNRDITASATLPNFPKHEQQPQQRYATAPHPVAHKPRITSMAQLVANMVFHRQQQDMGRKKPTRSRSWEPSVLSVTGAKTHWTPRSPLRQVLIPQEMEDDEDNSETMDSITGTTCESPLPLSPLCLTMEPLPLFFPEDGAHQ